MAELILYLEPATAAFYEKIAFVAGKPTEQVVSDALTLLAGALAAEALQNTSGLLS